MKKDDSSTHPFFYHKPPHQQTVSLWRLIEHERTSTPVLRYFAIDCARAARKLYESRRIEPLDNRLFDQFVRIFLDFLEGRANWSDASLEISAYVQLSIPVPWPTQQESVMHAAVINTMMEDPRKAALATADSYFDLMLMTPMSEGEAAKHILLMLERRISEEMEARRTLLEAFAKKIRIDTVVSGFWAELDKASFA